MSNGSNAETRFKIDLVHKERDGVGYWEATRWYDGAARVFVGELDHVLAELRQSVVFAE